MNLVKEVAEYYDSLAKGYHRRFYGNSESAEEEFSEIGSTISSLFTGRKVLEIACGTGFWSQIAAMSAETVHATDANESMITEAKKLHSDCTNIRFEKSDAYSLGNISGGFTAALSVLWWCHMPGNRVETFLNALHGKLKPGSKVLHVCQMEDLDSQNHTQDSDGNTVSLRKSADREYRILKNIPSEQGLMKLLNQHVQGAQYLRYHELGLWSVHYSL